MYMDDNISVFALPVVPSEVPPEAANPRSEAAGRLKRKRAESTPDSDPASLSGEAAQAWRQLMIQSMFPASQASAATPNQNGPRFPPKFGKPLPVPEPLLLGSSDPTLKPTIAYAIVGPRIRGKFDGKKAVDLGLPPGPLRARLVKGECVTVQVKDSNGIVVDREIKPEDCIGESVTPAVSQVSCFSWMG